MSIETILAQRRSDLESAIAVERMAHYQLGKKPGDAALTEEHRRCVGYVIEEIEKIECLRVSCTEVQELKALALGWIEQTQGPSDLVALREALRMQVADRIRTKLPDLY